MINYNIIKVILVIATLLFVYGVFCLFVGKYGWGLFHVLLNTYTIATSVRILKSNG